MPKAKKSEGQKRGIRRGSPSFNEFQLFSKRVRENINRLRLANNLTQEQMEEYELNLRQFQRIESGETSNMTLTYLFRIAKAFGVKPSHLIDV